jgi:hypothetical protein
MNLRTLKALRASEDERRWDELSPDKELAIPGGYESIGIRGTIVPSAFPSLG